MLNNFIWWLAVPYTIACYYNKFYIFVKRFDHNIRKCCNHVIIQKPTFLAVLWWSDSFVIKISKCSGKGKSSINTSIYDFTSCFDNSLSFCRKIWFVIFTQFTCISILWHHSSWITSICTINFIVSDKNHGCCTSSLGFKMFSKFDSTITQLSCLTLFNISFIFHVLTQFLFSFLSQ